MKYILITMMCWLMVGCNTKGWFLNDKEIVVVSKRKVKKGCDFIIKNYVETHVLHSYPCDCFDVGDTIQFTKVSAKDSIR
jgi:hypothetical protein